MVHYSTNSLSSNLSSFATMLVSFTAGGSSVEFQFPVSGAAASNKYLYFIPGPSGTDNDYLVWKAEVDRDEEPPHNPVPEPTTLLLLGSGLAGLGTAAWKKRRQK